VTVTPEPPDILSPEFAADPYPAYQVLREHYPVHYDAGTGSWLISRYEDVERAFRDPVFTSDNYDWQLEPVHGGRTIVQMSGHEHAVRRALVAPDGTFEIGGLRTGPVSLFVSTQRPSFIRANINRMEREGVAVNQNFVLKESLSGLHVVIDYGTGIIRGTVRFEGNDAPITDSRMYVNCRRAGARDGSGAPVDARGHFVISNLAPGSWEVTLQVNSLTPRPPRGIPIQKQIVNVANGSETEVTFVVALTPKQGGP